ncbi:MAG: maltose ABC transporter permease MalG [Verrucomicrobia bacterium]|nr:maltose ABC transporter permease MalG [Verrucomicrobiota bacterium]
MIVGKRDRVTLVFGHLFLCGFLLLVLFPFVMIISISFRQGNFALGSLIPEHPSLEHWKFVLGIPYADETGKMVKPASNVLLWFWNSIKVATLSSVLILLLSGTCAYAFARMKFLFKTKILNGLLLLQMFPMVLALVAIYSILDFVGRYVPALGLDTHPGLILCYLGGIAIHIWMIKGYFSTIPVSIEESAEMDGATPLQAFLSILLPMSLPVFAVVFILSFIGIIAEYPVASVVLQQSENWTLAVGANSFLYEQNYLWGKFAATAVLSGLPITTMFLLCQRFLISGLTSGSVKG